MRSRSTSARNLETLISCRAASTLTHRARSSSMETVTFRTDTKIRTHEVRVKRGPLGASARACRGQGRGAPEGPPAKTMVGAPLLGGRSPVRQRARDRTRGGGGIPAGDRRLPHWAGGPPPGAAGDVRPWPCAPGRRRPPAGGRGDSRRQRCAGRTVDRPQAADQRPAVPHLNRPATAFASSRSAIAASSSTAFAYSRFAPSRSPASSRIAAACSRTSALPGSARSASAM